MIWKRRYQLRNGGRADLQSPDDEEWLGFENVIDANTGRIADREIASSFELIRDDLGNIIALKSVRKELADAVRIAESAASGRALGGGLLKEDRHLSFVVLILSGDHLKEVTLRLKRTAKGQGSGPDKLSRSGAPNGLSAAFDCHLIRDAGLNLCSPGGHQGGGRAA